MGVNPLPTGGIYKYFTFDGETSASFGVHITGEGVFNAPKRAVEMVNIPARNGAFALDQGYFENIEVTYNASIVADTDADFADAISALRNFLCSRTGYCRLEDDYNPNEYRMAVYKSGLEVTPFFLKTGEFEITFDCKPQRFLKSGETAISVTSGDTITNPTLFDARPMLDIEGYGNITVNGYNISLFDDLVGTVYAERNANHFVPCSTYIGDIYVNANDAILLDSVYIGFSITRGSSDFTIASCVDSNLHYGGWSDLPLVSIVNNGETLEFGIAFNDVDFSALTAGEAWVTLTLTVTDSNGISFVNNYRATVKYDGIGSIFCSMTGINIPNQYYISTMPFVTYSFLKIVSTATTYGHPTLIDCDTGEAYTIKNDVVLSLGRYVALGSELPMLSIGTNSITYDNTINSLKITPRWWQV